MTARDLRQPPTPIPSPQGGRGGALSRTKRPHVMARHLPPPLVGEGWGWGATRRTHGRAA